jgi:Na+-driven multidrug efflux pump
VGDAAELQCAYHLGTNNPEMARLSAYKSVYVGLVSACFATSAVFFVGEDLVRWITPDPTLERLLLELLPLLGIGQVAMTASTIAWALVGAQGRSQLATGVHFFGTWGVTIPLSILLTYILNINLQGLLAALIVGLTLAGTGNMYILIRSQWGRLAKLEAAEYDTDDTSNPEDVSQPAAT